MNIVILASGRGSNLRALIQAQSSARAAFQIAAVVSDKPHCGALKIANEHGINNIALSPSSFASRSAHDEALTACLLEIQPRLIVCAGYLRILSANTVKAFEHRMINIHPSLLPKYPGLHTHQRALDAGDQVHGASVHGVIAELDAGPVFAQAQIKIEVGDSANTLAEKLLPYEHALMVAVVESIAKQELCWQDTVRYRGEILSQPLRLHGANQLGVF